MLPCCVTVDESIISCVLRVFVPCIMQLMEVVMQPVSITICILTLAALPTVTSRLPSQPTADSPDLLGNCLAVYVMQLWCDHVMQVWCDHVMQLWCDHVMQVWCDHVMQVWCDHVIIVILDVSN